EVEPPVGPQALGESRYEVVAIANPEIAPYGAAAREALQQLGVWEAIEPRIVQGENIAQTYQFVQTGNADVALVARSVVDTAGRRVREVGVWEAIEPRIEQGENTAQTYQFVQTGNADVALVARSVVDTAATEFIPIDSQLHTPIRQAAGILERSANPAAEQFL